jgi:hypothetical protein
VLTNLVDNAVRFTEQGFVALHVRQLDAGPGLEHQLLLRAEVQDSGIGIPEAAQPGLFVVPSGRRFAHPPLRRHRPGPGHQPPPGRPDGRTHRRGQHPGQRLVLLVHGAV